MTIARHKPQPDEPTQRVLSLLTPKEVQSLGTLPGEAILGVFAGSTDSLESASRNPPLPAVVSLGVDYSGTSDSVSPGTCLTATSAMCRW
jgi:hypothetical protein